MAKERLDNLLVKRGIIGSREKAKAVVMAGSIFVDSKRVIKSGMLVREDAKIENLSEKPPFVSRGGIKLAYALEEFQIDVASKVALDIGASTGGFTDCLLERGATKVYAVDVGRGQLDTKLREDPRVVVMEKINARYPFQLPNSSEAVDLATMDVSFISVEKIIPNISKMVKENGPFLVLLKPQFEAGRRDVGKGGVVKDPLVHSKVLGRFISWSVKQGFRLKGLTQSPLLGAKGNKEFFVLLEKDAYCHACSQ
jgi:23S rRNA (cytidine1920-2'-O)/16S rRNA (cytidine1409-2'-O)-methyltransferase